MIFWDMERFEVFSNKFDNELALNTVRLLRDTVGSQIFCNRQRKNFGEKALKSLKLCNLGIEFPSVTKNFKALCHFQISLRRTALLSKY